MIIKFILYILIFLVILLLPERFWEICWTRARYYFTYFKKYWKENPFQKEEKLGAKLLEFFPQLEAQLSMGVKTTSIDIPRYKFYTNFLFELLQFYQKRGVSLKTILPELRGNLIKDLQFEKKLKSNILGGNLQFLAITITTWGFILFSSQMAQLPLRPINLMVIFLLQFSGVIVFNAFLKKIKSVVFNKFDQSIERLYLFVSMIEIGLPVGVILSESKVLEGEFMKHSLFSPCAQRLTSLIKRWSENGISPKIETGEIIRELWHLKEVNFERFLKHLDLLKFIVLAFFFLPAYFFYLYSIFQFFMEQ
jgi:hypothetical protein